MDLITKCNISNNQQVLSMRLAAENFLFIPKVDRKSLFSVLSCLGTPRMHNNGLDRYCVKAGNVFQPQDGAAIGPHTDEFNAEGPPPRLVALHCINPGNGGGAMLFADGCNWLDTLTHKQQTLLRLEWPFKKEDQYVYLPALSDVGNEIILRISPGFMQYARESAMGLIMDGLKEWFVVHARAIMPTLHSLFVFNNWRVIHGRRAYDDLAREQHRYYLD